MKDLERVPVIQKNIAGFRKTTFEIPPLTLIPNNYFDVNTKFVLAFFFEGCPIIISELKTIESPQKWVDNQNEWMHHFQKGWNHIQQESVPVFGYGDIRQPYQSFEIMGNYISQHFIEINPYYKRYKKFIDKLNISRTEIKQSPTPF